jgi:hypothetical protein
MKFAALHAMPIERWIPELLDRNAAEYGCDTIHQTVNAKPTNEPFQNLPRLLCYENSPVQRENRHLDYPLIPGVNQGGEEL